VSEVENIMIGGFRDCDLTLGNRGPTMELEIRTNWSETRMELNEDMAIELRDWLNAWIGQA
jgi:hypothetical protein